MSEPLKAGQQVTIMRLGGVPMAAEVIEDRGADVLLRDERGKRREVARSRVMVAHVPPVMGNATSTPVYGVGGGVATPKDPPSRDAKYLAFVRACSCCACGAPGPSDAHHWALRGRSGGGMAMKADDLRTVPLCRRCHDHYHSTGHVPESTTITTRILFLAKQTDLLVKWIKKGEKQ